VRILQANAIEQTGDRELPQLYTLTQVAHALNLSPHTIRSFVRQGKLHPARICRRLLFEGDQVSKLLKNRKDEVQPETAQDGTEGSITKVMGGGCN
jgi:hypothetical protein